MYAQTIQPHLKICLESSLPSNIYLTNSLRFSAQVLPLQREVVRLPNLENVATSPYHSHPSTFYPTPALLSHYPIVILLSSYCLFFITHLSLDEIIVRWPHIPLECNSCLKRTLHILLLSDVIIPRSVWNIRST